MNKNLMPISLGRGEFTLKTGLELQGLGVMPRLNSSLFNDFFIQAARLLSPSFAASFSSCSLNSGCSRIWNCGDLFSSLYVDMVITIEVLFVCGNYHTRTNEQISKQLSQWLEPLREPNQSANRGSNHG